MTAEYVRRTYGVPAKRGGRVTVDGQPGRIVSFPGAHLGVRLDAQPNRTVRAHPTWRVTYHPGAGTAAAVVPVVR